MLAQRAHQLEVERNVGFGHGEEIAVGHLVEEFANLVFGRLGSGQLLTDPQL